MQIILYLLKILTFYPLFLLLPPVVFLPKLFSIYPTAVTSSCVIVPKLVLTFVIGFPIRASCR